MPLKQFYGLIWKKLFFSLPPKMANFFILHPNWKLVYKIEFFVKTLLVKTYQKNFSTSGKIWFFDRCITNEYKCITLNTHIFHNFFILHPKWELTYKFDFFVRTLRGKTYQKNSSTSGKIWFFDIFFTTFLFCIQNENWPTNSIFS